MAVQSMYFLKHDVSTISMSSEPSTSTLPPVDDDEHDAPEEELPEGMDPDGFAGPSQIVKPLTKEALAAFKAEQDRAGVIYISRIPPGMRPTKVRHIMSGYGEVGRVYLQQEGAPILPLFIHN